VFANNELDMEMAPESPIELPISNNIARDVFLYSEFDIDVAPVGPIEL